MPQSLKKQQKKKPQSKTKKPNSSKVIVDDAIEESTLHRLLFDQTTVLQNLLNELKLLRKDLKTQKQDSKEALDAYKKWMEDMMKQKVTTLGQIAFPNLDPESLKKNTAKMIRNMMRPEMAENMPKEFQEAYHALLSGIMKPNDPAFDTAEPDPREPVHPTQEDIEKAMRGEGEVQLTPEPQVIDMHEIEEEEEEEEEKKEGE